jgi:hypothetical protein
MRQGSRVGCCHPDVARLTGGFIRHRGLIVLSVGGAVAETALLTWVAPGARALGPQVTALPPLAAYHDLRWLFALGWSWPAFIAMVACVLAARSAVDAVLVQLAWPEQGAKHRPRFMAAFWSCAVLTPVVWVVLSAPRSRSVMAVSGGPGGGGCRQRAPSAGCSPASW